MTLSPLTQYLAHSLSFNTENLEELFKTHTFTELSHRSPSWQTKHIHSLTLNTLTSFAAFGTAPESSETLRAVTLWPWIIQSNSANMKNSREVTHKRAKTNLWCHQATPPGAVPFAADGPALWVVWRRPRLFSGDVSSRFGSEHFYEIKPIWV